MERRRGVAYWLGRAWLGAFGWRVEGEAPAVRKAVVVAAPHTSAWDWPFTLATAAVLGVEMRWVGKHTLFENPLMGRFMRWTGGLPVDRAKTKDMVTKVADLLRAHEDLFLIVAPEGTRRRADRWKTGFYYMARAADVPVVLGYLDYAKKTSGLGTLFYPTGDLHKDMRQIRAFYSDVSGKHPERTSEVSVGVEPALRPGLFGQSPRWGTA
ncbi:MAG TPA: 1-acyl-sn-glycerol-3-phosphate acyltransferase [Polyangiaceae bacterium]|nr:1-acyl-sn-glycerol-3-phosphate acyltransferase [Polyangiaceae bacterium]